MSDIFTPFTPAPAPETPAAKPARKPRAKKADKAPKRTRKVVAVNLPSAGVDLGRGTYVVEPAPAKTRKKRTVPKVRLPKSIKLPVNHMLLAMAELNTSDGTLFEKLLGLLTAAGKGQRQRVLAALGKVF